MFRSATGVRARGCLSPVYQDGRDALLFRASLEDLVGGVGIDK